MISLPKLLTRSTKSKAQFYLIKRYQSSSVLSVCVKDNIISSGLPDVIIPNCNINELIYDQTKNFERYTATECSITGRKYTYLEIRKKSKNLAKALRKKLKLQRNDVIAVISPNIPEYPIAVLGSLEANLTVTTCSPVYVPDEIARQLLDSNTKAVITTVDLCANVILAVANCKKNIPIISIKTERDQVIPSGTIHFKEFIDNEVDFSGLSNSEPDDLAFLPYSSGTTGLPKGVELTHKNLVSNITQSKNISPLEDTTDTVQEIVPAVLPFYHIYGLSVISLSSLTKGSKIITVPKFTPELYISTLKNNHCTHLYLVPPIVLFMTAFPDVKPEYLKKCRTITPGAAPLAASDEEKFREKFGNHIEISQGYGLTESSPVLTMCHTKVHNSFPDKCQGSVGTPLPNTLVKVCAIDDTTYTPLGPNIPGELLAKGPQIMKGYHNKPEETNSTIVEDGWLKTGDRVYYTPEGLIFITDRLKELIKVKGFQVAPAELEGIIRSHPDVSDAAVIGIPHEISGEVPRAYIVSKPNSKLDENTLDHFVSEQVAHYKRLKGGIEFVTAIPKNPSGKILRRQIKLEYLKKIGGSS